MIASLVKEPALSWAIGQNMTVFVTPLTLPVGRALTDFASFTLTIRQDPLWPRTGANQATRNTADPIGENWLAVVTSTGSLTIPPGGTSQVPTFNFAMPNVAGLERYAVDVWGALNAGGLIQLVVATWLTGAGRVN